MLDRYGSCYGSVYSVKLLVYIICLGASARRLAVQYLLEVPVYLSLASNRISIVLINRT